MAITTNISFTLNYNKCDYIYIFYYKMTSSYAVFNAILKNSVFVLQ